MKTAEDIESYLLRMQLPYEEIRPGMWMIHADATENLVISIGGPVLVFRLKVMELPPKNGDGRERLFHTLLELNANEMLHAGYGIEGQNVVMADALELENLDYNEFQATVDDILLGVAKHYPRLAPFRKAAA